MPIRLAGIIADQAYHAAEVEPKLNGTEAVWIGLMEGAARARFVGSARALLHLITFDEPFGLSVVEAMVCGTPVIALRRGSMPELIDDGVTGYLVEHLSDVPDAIAKLPGIDRATGAAHARARFAADVMARNYEALYLSLIGNR